MKTQTKTLILTGISIAGVVTTTILSNKATLKVSEVLNDEDKDVKEKIKETWKDYIPAAVAGTVTIACICLNHSASTKALTAIASAGTFSSNLVERYRTAIRDKYGEEGLTEIQQIVAESAENREIYSCGLVSMNKSLPSRGEIVHFYDETLDKWFDATMMQVLNAEYHLNRNFSIGGDVSVSDYADFLGLSNDDPENDNLIWSMDGGYSWIDFDHTKATTDKGVVYYIISTPFGPEHSSIYD